MGAAPQLKPHHFKPGQSGNPSGRPALPPELKAIRSITQLELNKRISKYGLITHEELLECLKDKSLAVIDRAICRIYEESIEKGDFARLTFLLDRAVGKIPTQMEFHDDDDERSKIAKMSFQELLMIVKNAIPDLPLLQEENVQNKE